MKHLVSFIRAIWSFIRYGDVPLEEANNRELICVECSEMRFTSRNPQRVSDGMHCNACGCPPNAISDLRTKWRMADIKCPLDKW